MAARRVRLEGPRPPALLRIALAATALAAACAKRPPPGPPEPGGTLRVAVLHPLDLPAPLADLDPTTAQLFEHVVPPLGRIDERNNVQLLLARDDADWGGRVDFTLRRARWEDGARVVPRDFVLATTLLRDPRLRF